MKKLAYFIMILVVCSSCSWIDRKLAESNGEYYQTLNCTSELAIISTKQIITEENYSGLIINQDGDHSEIWFKLNETQRVRVTFKDHYFWDTIVSFYCTEGGSRELADDFYKKLEEKIFGIERKISIKRVLQEINFKVLLNKNLN